MTQEQNVYGDGNVYRGVRSANSNNVTIDMTAHEYKTLWYAAVSDIEKLQARMVEATDMLRRHHEAIVKLREALENVSVQYDYHGNPMDDCDRMVIAALADTEELK